MHDNKKIYVTLDEVVELRDRLRAGHDEFEVMEELGIEHLGPVFAHKHTNDDGTLDIVFVEDSPEARF